MKCQELSVLVPNVSMASMVFNWLDQSVLVNCFALASVIFVTADVEFCYNFYIFCSFTFFGSSNSYKSANRSTSFLLTV